MVSITGRFNCKQMDDAQLEEYLWRTRNLIIDITKAG